MAAGCPHIITVIERLPASALWGEVLEAASLLRHEPRLRRLAMQPGGTKIDDPHSAGAGGRLEACASLYKHILPVKVSMHKAHGMKMCKAVQKRSEPLEQSGRRMHAFVSTAWAWHQVAELESVEVLSDYVKTVGMNNALVIPQDVPVHGQTRQVVQLLPEVLLVLLEGIL